MYSWNFNLIRRISLISVIVLLCNCGGGMKVSADPFSQTEDEFEAIKAGILAAGGVADIGISQSPRRDIAKMKARELGAANLASIYETQVKRLSKVFIEELGESADVEINEAFSQATKTIVKQKMNLVSPKKTKYLEETVDGKTMYTCYIIMAIEPGVLNQSLMDELKNKNVKTYERFRASKAYEELDKAMEEYEASDGNN